LIQTYSAGGSDRSVTLYYCQSPTNSSSLTFTSTSGTGGTTFFVQAWSGSASSPLDQHTGVSGTGNPATVQTGAVTPTANNALIVACADATVVFGSVTVDSGFTQAPAGLAFAYLVQSTAGSINPTFTASGAFFSSWAGAIASFLPPAGDTLLAQSVL
jgi:hypothetical protein